MAGFSTLETLPGDASGFLTSVTGMVILPENGGNMLYLANSRGGGLSAYAINADGTLSFSGSEAYASQSSTLASATLLTPVLNGKQVLLPVGFYDSQLTSYGLNADGSLTGKKAAVTVPSTALPTETAHPVSVELGGNSFLYTAHANGAAPDAWQFVSAASAQLLPAASGTDAPLGSITAMGAMQAGTQEVLLAGFSGSDRVTSFLVGSNGHLTQADSLGAADGLCITTPDAIASATVGGHTYAVVASAGTSTLTVLQVGADGHMTATDQVVDDLNTRFAGADLVTMVAQGGHEFVLASGTDDGLSLFALTNDGHLEHLSTLANSATTTLAHASAMTAIAQGSALDVYVSSATEPGLTALKVDLSNFGAILDGGAAGGTTTGTSHDDILISHSGLDALKGGAGADLFVFDPAGATADGKLGTVMDFTPGTDKLDLSRLPMFYDVSQMHVVSTAHGANLYVGNTWVEVDSSTGASLSASQFSNANVLNVEHQAVSLGADPYTANTGGSTPAGLVITTGGGNDNITGDAGNDTLSGGGGNDTIAGLDGNDVIHAGDGADHVLGGNGDDLIYGGDTSLDGGDSIDAGEGNNTVDGGWGNDTITAGAGNDLLVGGQGNDSINAGDGANTIRGGDGQDTLVGGAGNDSILGGDDSLDAHDVIYGGLGNDTIDAGYGNDSVSGGGGNDSILGNFGADTLIGNDGNDTVSGGPGSDLMFGGPGDDFLNGGFGNDRMNGGTGADTFYHGGTANEGSDWIQDYNAAEGDVLKFGNASATASQFQVNYATTEGAGDAAVQEAFVIYKPTGQIIWALVDGGGQHHIELQIAGQSGVHDLLV